MGVRKEIIFLHNSYAYNKLYNNLICLAEDFRELKGGLKK